MTSFRLVGSAFKKFYVNFSQYYIIYMIKITLPATVRIH